MFEQRCVIFLPDLPISAIFKKKKNARRTNRRTGGPTSLQSCFIAFIHRFIFCLGLAICSGATEMQQLVVIVNQARGYISTGIQTTSGGPGRQYTHVVADCKFLKEGGMQMILWLSLLFMDFVHYKTFSHRSSVCLFYLSLCPYVHPITFKNGSFLSQESGICTRRFRGKEGHVGDSHFSQLEPKSNQSETGLSRDQL